MESQKTPKPSKKNIEEQKRVNEEDDGNTDRESESFEVKRKGNDAVTPKYSRTAVEEELKVENLEEPVESKGSLIENFQGTLESESENKDEENKVEEVVPKEEVSEPTDLPVPEEGKIDVDKKNDYDSSLTEVITKISNILDITDSHDATSAGTSQSINFDLSELYSKLNESHRNPRKKRFKRSVVVTYPESQRSRQPFLNRTLPPNQMPNPPAYYTNSLNQNSPQRRYMQTREPRQEIVFQPNQALQVGPGQMMAMMPNLMGNIAYWAPYPDNIPSNVPACLAHLVAADSLFIIQQKDIIELFMDITEPNYYLIQNTSGQCLYYAYETSNFSLTQCDSCRSFQLHIMDMYHNEIIYMSKPCGCNNCFCCFPVLEVYSPPMIPVGAITQKYSCCGTEFVILDADENIAFSIHGPSCCITSLGIYESEFTIHAHDWEHTEIGIIRRQLAGLVTSYYTNTDYYGITFPVDLDVRIKAVFLGALFLIEYSYYD